MNTPSLPNHFTFEVNEQDWEFGRRAGLNYVPVRCAVWQAMVRSFPALELQSDPDFYVAAGYIHYRNDIWDLDQTGINVVIAFDHYRDQPLPVVIEATLYTTPAI